VHATPIYNHLNSQGWVLSITQNTLGLFYYVFNFYVLEFHRHTDGRAMLQEIRIWVSNMRN